MYYLDKSHFNRHEIIHDCDSDLSFADDLWCWIFSYTPVGYLCIFIWEMSIQFLWSFFNWTLFFLLSCFSSLYILNINSISGIWFENMFSPSLSCLLTLSVISFTEQKLLLVWCNPISLFLLLLSVFMWSYPKNHCSDLCQGIFSIYFLPVVLQFPV